MKTKVNPKIFLIISIIAFAIFFAMIVVLKKVDVCETGVEDTVVGLSTINFFVRDAIDVNLTWYRITDLMIFLGIAVASFFAVFGMWQWIKRKNIFKVDFEILSLGVFYSVVIATYFFFMFCAVNYRPVIIETEIESSFPSSHTFVTLTIITMAIPLIQKYLKDKKTWRTILYVACAIIMTLTVVGRVISGVHWISDIVCGVILSVAIASLYFFVINADLKLKKFVAKLADKKKVTVIEGTVEQSKIEGTIETKDTEDKQ